MPTAARRCTPRWPGRRCYRPSSARTGAPSLFRTPRLPRGNEGVSPARLNLARLRAYRKSEVHGNAYRRPQVYAPLAGEAVLPPFVRPDRRP